MPKTKPTSGVASLIGRPMLAGAIAACAVAASSSPALAQRSATPAASDIFLYLENIPGESTDKDHKGWIDILSYGQTFSNTTTVGPATGGAGAGKVTCGDISVSKVLDKSSTSLIKYVVTGEHINKAVITFRTVGANAHDYFEVDISDVLVTSVKNTDTNPARMLEGVTLVGLKYEFKYRTVDSKGNIGDWTGPVGYDCSENQVL